MTRAEESSAGPDGTPRVPAIRPAPNSGNQAYGDAVLGGLSRLVSAPSAAIDRLPHNPEEMVVFLHMRLHTADSARERGRWWPGRLYNRMSGEDPDYIPISGTHLGQVLRILGFELPKQASAGGQYQLRADIARQAYQALRNTLTG